MKIYIKIILDLILKNIKKLGLGIVCFEGSEHLYNIIYELRDIVDYIVIGIQKISYNGENIDNTDLYEVNRLKKIGFIDKIIYIDTDKKKFPRIQETDKRNSLMRDIQDNGCSHALIIDSDEYYVRNSFKKALDKIDRNNYEITYCQYVNYYKDYRHYLVYPYSEGMYVPFVTRSRYRFEWQGQDFPLPSDPTRRYSRPKILKMNPVTHQAVLNPFTHRPETQRFLVDYYVFPWEELKMHHFSWIRYNIRKKMNVWSSKSYFGTKKALSLIDRSADTFDKPIIAGQETTLLFNVPDNKVEIQEFPRQFVFPKEKIQQHVCLQPNKRNIIFLAMSCNREDYKILETSVRNTWAKDIIDGKYDNIRFYFYTATDGEERIDEEHHIIYVKTEDTFERTYQKTMHVLKLLKKKEFKFDYIVRTNTSTYVNVPLVNEFISFLTDDSIVYTGEIEACFWSKMYFYGQGSFLILSRNIISKLLEYEHYDWEKEFNASDDTIIGATLNNYYLENKLCHRNYIKSVGLPYNFGKAINNDVNYNHVMCARVKTEIPGIKDEKILKQYTYDKMIALHKLFSSIDESNFKYFPDILNKNKVVWIEDKKKWIEDKDNEFMHKTSLGIYNNWMISYDDAVERQKKLNIN